MKQLIGKHLQKIVGYTLLLPSLFSVVIFFYLHIMNEAYSHTIPQIEAHVMGIYSSTFIETGNTGNTSALPFYFGLLAIAGAYLVANDKK